VERKISAVFSDKRFFEAGHATNQAKAYGACQTYAAPDCWRKRAVENVGVAAILHRIGPRRHVHSFSGHLLRRSPDPSRARSIIVSDRCATSRRPKLKTRPAME